MRLAECEWKWLTYLIEKSSKGRMKMANHNSSKTRVNQLMDSVIKENGTKMTELLNLMEDGHRNESWSNRDIGTIQAIYYENSVLKEKSLPPTAQRLIWLVENLNQANGNRELPENKTTKRRKELISGEKRTILEAKNNILTYDGSISFPHKWWVLEGSSQPDIFMITDKYIFVCEAKRTEDALAKSTNLDVDRVHMVRQIEGAMKYEKYNVHHGHEREIIAFYILSDAFIEKEGNKDDLDNAMLGEASMWDNSLKHLSHQSIEEIKETYLGFTTWEEISKTMGFIFTDPCLTSDGQTVDKVEK